MIAIILSLVLYTPADWTAMVATEGAMVTLPTPTTSRSASPDRGDPAAMQPIQAAPLQLTPALRTRLPPSPPVRTASQSCASGVCPATPMRPVQQQIRIESAPRPAPIATGILQAPPRPAVSACPSVLLPPSSCSGTIYSAAPACRGLW